MALDRKSPSNADSSAAPIVLRRARIGGIFGYLGVSLLLAAIVGTVWAADITVVSVVLFVLGIVCIFLWYAVAPRAFLDLITGRQVRYGTIATFSTLLLIAIVALVYGLLARSAIVVDMTEARRFSLSAESLRVLSRVREPMRIIGFYTPDYLTAREIDDQFFRLYEEATGGLIGREYFDPEAFPAIAQQYAVTEPGQVYLAQLDAEGGVDFNTLSRVPRGSSQERDMTGAISRQLIAGTITVYFVSGHGERDPFDGLQEGINGINNGVRESGLITEILDLPALAAAAGDVPTDAAAIIFARPLIDLTAEEIAVIDRYVARGGSLFLMADALFTENAFMREGGAFNDYLWTRFGVRGRDQVVVDSAASGQTALDVISAVVYTENDIGSRLDPANGTPAVFRLARALELNSTPPENILNGRVIQSSPESYGETNFAALAETNTYTYDAGVDVPGPLDMALWAYDESTDSRVVLIGDGDFVANGQVLNGGNGILFTDALSWLTRLESQIDFSPQAYVTGLPLIFISGQTINAIGFVTIILMPLIVAGVGVIVWRRRAAR